MATKKINYNSRITACMHRPVTNGANKYVLYPKIKDFKGTVEGSTLAEQDAEYQQKSQSYSNSPTNIRQLFITGKRVYTYLYKAIQTPANKDISSFMKTYEDYCKDKSEENDMTEIAKKVLKYKEFRANPSAIAMSKAIGEKEPDQYIVEGNILGAIANPYTCNNIEEIYLDWTIFLSTDPIVQQSFDNQFTSPEGILTFMQGNYSGQEINYSKQIMNLFKQTCMGGVKDLRKRFPRLKMIAIISKLDDLITSNNTLMIHSLVSETDSNNKDKYGKTWYELNRKRIAASGSLCFICPIGGSNKDIFEIKDNHYRFDRDYLKPEVDSFIKKIKDADRKARYGFGENSTVSLEKEDTGKITVGSNEQYLLDLEAKYGFEYVANILAIAAIGETQTSLAQFFTDFTKPNRVRFANKVGLKL